MTHLETEIKALKESTVEMFQLVVTQLTKAQKSFVGNEKDLAREVLQKEKRVNALELKIDRDCEDILALYNPVAVDLRFVLAVLKINNNLERIGDIAESIAHYVIESNVAFSKTILEEAKLYKMFDESVMILQDTMKAFDTEDTKLARSIFKRDDILNGINLHAIKTVGDIITKTPTLTEEALFVLSSIRKLERVGDQCMNMAEEIIFYIEAKVLKHNKSAKAKENK